MVTGKAGEMVRVAVRITAKSRTIRTTRGSSTPAPPWACSQPSRPLAFDKDVPVGTGKKVALGSLREWVKPHFQEEPIKGNAETIIGAWAGHKNDDGVASENGEALNVTR